MVAPTDEVDHTALIAAVLLANVLHGDLRPPRLTDPPLDPGSRLRRARRRIVEWLGHHHRWILSRARSAFFLALGFLQRALVDALSDLIRDSILSLLQVFLGQ